MIAIAKTSNVPKILRHDDAHNNRLKKIYKKIGGSCNKKRISASTYANKEVRKKLFDLYKGKCAYCETKDPEFEIEHYRPKKAVDGERHSGYFWLSNEWTNLLPACHDCNKKRSKATKFPIEGVRVSSPSIQNGTYCFSNHLLDSNKLKNEIPLLINPEEKDFNPRDYFKFLNDGKMVSVGKTTLKARRAEKTIDIIRLNRDRLYLISRKTLLRKYKIRITYIYHNYLKYYIKYDPNFAADYLRDAVFLILSEIKLMSNREEEFSYFWTFVYENIFNFLPKRVVKKTNSRRIFIDLINEYKFSTSS